MAEIKSKSLFNRKAANIVTTAIAVIIGIFIIGLLFFKFMPGYSFYVVRSGSMEPAIGVGNVIFTGPVSNVNPGTIITFQKNGETVTHRVYSIDNGQITTKGDANKAPDQGTITIADVRGVYLFQAPGVGYITQLASTKKGWFLIVIVPSMLLVLFLVKDILKEAFKNDKKKVAAAAGTLASQSTAPATVASPDKSGKKSFFSFILFNNGSPKPAVKVARPLSSARPVSQEPINVVAEQAMPETAVNMTSATYQNISSPEVASSVAPEKKAKRPFYSFLLFDDETQKAPMTASTPVATKTATRPVVVDYPAAEVQKPAAPMPAPSASSPVNPADSATEPVSSSEQISPVNNPVSSSPSAGRRNPDAVIARYLASKAVLLNETATEPMQAIPVDSVYIKKEQPPAPMAAKQAPEAKKGCVFSNQEVHERVKNEIKKLLSNYN